MSVSGACIINKMSGICYIREDVSPPVMEWKSIEENHTITVPLDRLINLQATKETSPKVILKLIYKEDDKEKDVKLNFKYRNTMNIIKEALQTIISRQRTVVTESKDKSNTASPGPDASTSTSIDLSDAQLLKNHQLQQKLLLEDKSLRNLFTQSVINYKLSPTVFWSSRLNILRTYAITVSQQRGPYNVLSTIKPIATSDNQVNVNVTRTIINEIFDTYPIVKKAFDDLVPAKFQEGEFWSRFFNSKLFRRLRGDRIKSTDRGDLMLDKYMFINSDDTTAHEVSKFINIEGNEEDNTITTGNKPDFTMKFENDKTNETILLMENMNKLSSKMINVDKEETPDKDLRQEYVEEVTLKDLNDEEDLNFVGLNLNLDLNKSTAIHQKIDINELRGYLESNKLSGTIELSDVYKTSDNFDEIMTIVKQNYKKTKSHKQLRLDQEKLNQLKDLNLTVTEFLSHFWKIYFNESNSGQLKKIFVSLKNCKKKLVELKEEMSKQAEDDKQRMEIAAIFAGVVLNLDKALAEYVRAVREDEVNENGKRPASEEIQS